MGSFLILYVILDLVLRNPILALIILAIIYYFVDRRYIGFVPNLLRPIRRRMRGGQLQRQIQVNPNDAPARYDYARVLIEAGNFRRAHKLLEALPESMQEAADVQCDRAVCELNLGSIEMGEQRMLEALQKEPLLRYGEPYLQLAAVLEKSHPQRALAYLRKFQDVNVSSCECEYRLANLLLRFDDKEGAAQALQRCIQTYRGLPKFRKRVERRWAARARLRRMF